MTYVIVRQNHSISDVLLKLAERRSTERTHSTQRGHVAVVVPIDVPRALIMITSVDRLGSVALTLSKPGFFWAPKTKGGHIVPP